MQQYAGPQQHRVSRYESHLSMTEEVIKNCFKLLHALAYKNNAVRLVYFVVNIYIFYKPALYNNYYGNFRSLTGHKTVV